MKAMRVKNAFFLSEEDAEETYQYRAVLCNFKATFKTTYGQLAEKMDKYADSCGAEPDYQTSLRTVCKWLAEHHAAATLSMVCEIQYVLAPYLASRQVSHFGYLVNRADSMRALGLDLSRQVLKEN